MSRALITLRNAEDRERAHKWVTIAPPATRLEFKAPRRSLPQNDLFWALLTDVATQLTWHRHKLNPEGWKFLFLDLWKRDVLVVPSLDNETTVTLGRSSSDLTKDEMSQVIEIIYAWGTKNGVIFKHERN